MKFFQKNFQPKTLSLDLDIPTPKKPCQPSETGLSFLYNNPNFWVGTTRVRTGINSQLLALTLENNSDVTHTPTFKQWLGY